MNKIEITRINEKENLFQLLIEDDKVATTVRMSLDDLLDLRDKVQDGIHSVELKQKEVVWNKRSQRHEIIEKDTEK